MPTEFTLDGPLPEGRIAVVVSRYNAFVTDKLLSGALEALLAGGIPEATVDVARVPGAWELSATAARLLASGRYLAVIVLGAVIKGETDHDRYINHAVSVELAATAARTGVPVLFGLLTCDTVEQAVQRAGGRLGNKGSEAAEAALQMVRLFTQLPPVN